MSAKKNVMLRIESESTSDPGKRRVWTVRGDMYLKAGSVWVRYPEPEMEQTMTTLKVRSGQITIVRHGPVRSEQTFRKGHKSGGYYRMPYGRLELSMQTHDMNVHLRDGIGTIAWSYDLFMDERFSGTFALKLEIREDGT